MAQIVLLPVGPQGPDHYRRQYDDLATAHARGLDLGSRSLHIKAGCERLSLLYKELEEALSEINFLLDNSGFQHQDFEISLRDLNSSAEHLFHLAQRIPQLFSKSIR